MTMMSETPDYDRGYADGLAAAKSNFRGVSLDRAIEVAAKGDGRWTKAEDIVALARQFEAYLSGQGPEAKS